MCLFVGDASVCAPKVPSNNSIKRETRVSSISWEILKEFFTLPHTSTAPTEQSDENAQKPKEEKKIRRIQNSREKYSEHFLF